MEQVLASRSETTLHSPPGRMCSATATTRVRAHVDALVGDGMRVVLETLLEVEARAYVGRHHGLRDARGRALVARNGVTRVRTVPMGPVSVTVRAPRVNDRRVVDGVRQRFASAVLPAGRAPHVGGAHKLAAAFLRSWGTGDFSAVRRHLAAAGLAGGIEVEAGLSALRRAQPPEPFADLCFESLFAVALPTDAALALAPGAAQAFVLAGELPSGRLCLLDIAMGDRSRAAWQELLEQTHRRSA